MRVPWWVWALAATVLVAGLLSPFASRLPDGLESVIEREAIPVAQAEQPSPLPDYQTPGVRNPRLGVFIAAAAGVVLVTLVTLAIGHLAARAAGRRRAEASAPEDHGSPV